MLVSRRSSDRLHRLPRPRGVGAVAAAAQQVAAPGDLSRMHNPRTRCEHAGPDFGCASGSGSDTHSAMRVLLVLLLALASCAQSSGDKPTIDAPPMSTSDGSIDARPVDGKPDGSTVVDAC